MKQIIPFKKELLFKTKVSEITSISLEHTLSLKSDDFISGEFHIAGDYKMTEGSINREKFNFKLPFDIALDSKYAPSSIVIDIDNFYYEVVNNETLQVNIDVYVEGEKIEEEILEEHIDDKSELEEAVEVMEKTEVIDSKEDNIVIPSDADREEVLESGSEEEVHFPEEDSTRNSEEEQVDSLESISYQAPKLIDLEEEKKQVIQNNEFHIFENMDNSDTYVTYHVYIVKENDTIDKIMEKYGVTKEDISLYNNIEDMKPGMKLIIPNANE